jgi:hypothetical protein
MPGIWAANRAAGDVPIAASPPNLKKSRRFINFFPTAYQNPQS